MKKIVVLGGGISGYGSAILAKKKGFDVFLSDKGRIADRYKAKLEQWQVPYEEGHHSEERILAADEVIKSPGIPDKAPLIVKLREAGIPVISEMEFAGRYLGKARTICVTGSNGKTTTTSLIYKILRDAGYNVALGGNIGESFAYSVATGDYDWYVLELSSFQLDGMFRFRAHIGVLTNITPDHLDRYDYCFQNYVDAKMRITQNQNSRDFFIYSGDDEVIWQQLPKYDLRMKQLPFAAKNAVASGAGDAFLLDGKFTATVGRESVEIDTAKMRIPGLHNAYNAMAAALAALAAGVSPTRIRSSIYDFAPVEHRLRTRRRDRRRGLHQRLESHQRRFHVVRTGEYETSRSLDRRRYGQRQRLRAAQAVRPRKSAYARLHGHRQPQAGRKFHGHNSRNHFDRFARRGDAGGPQSFPSGRRGVAFTGLCELRPLQKLRKPGRTVQTVGRRTREIIRWKRKNRRRKRPAIRTQRVRLCRPTHPDRSPA